MGAALCCGCVVNPSARRSAHLSPFARGLFAKSLGRKGEADHRAHPHSLPPHRLPFLITCSSPGQLWEAFCSTQQKVLCVSLLNGRPPKIPRVFFFFFPIYFPLLIFFFLTPRAKNEGEKNAGGHIVFFFPPPSAVKYFLMVGNKRISGLGLHFVFASLFFLIHP